jgi:hypothetical protein
MTDRLAALEQLAAEASRDLDLPADSPQVVTLSALRLAHQLTVERMLTGSGDHATTLLNLSEAIAKLSPMPQMPAIRLEIIKPVDAAPPDGPAVDRHVSCRRCGWQPPGNDVTSLCYRCGWRSGDDTSAVWRPPFIDGVIEATAPQPQRALEPPKPVHPNDQPRVHPGSIHDAVLPNGEVARMRRNDYSRIDPNAGASGIPLNRAGVPTVDRYHRLPWPIIE